MPETFDYIVLGAGGFGSSVLYHLARRGARAVAIERFGVAHDRGSSHGETRIIRKAYFEHPDYVPLLRRAYERWADLETHTNQRLYYSVGVLEAGPEDGIVVPGVLRAAHEHQLRVESLSAREASRRFPALSGLEEAGLSAVFERDAGYLLCEPAVRAWADQARLQGATLHTGAAVTSWRMQQDSFLVETEAGSYEAEQLLLCPGAWAPQLLPAEIARHLIVRRKVLLWYQAGHAFHEETGFPVWLFELPKGVFYGFPVRGERGLKIARHSGGIQVYDALRLDRELHAEDHHDVDQFISRHLAGLPESGPRDHADCM